MYKEVIYFCAELLNYWSMTFFGLKLFAKVYEIHVNENKVVENILFALMCLPISIFAAGNYFYVIYSTALTYSIVIYIYVVLKIIYRKNKIVSLSTIAFYVFAIRLVDLWIVTVMEEANSISRDMYIDLINPGMGRVVFLLNLCIGYYFLYMFVSRNNCVLYLEDNKFYCRMLCLYCLIGNGCFSRVYLLDYKESIIGYWTFYLICAFIMIGIFLVYFVGIKAKEKERLLNMRNDMMEANYQGLKIAYEANKTLQHDHKNHMLAMYELVKEHKNQEALHYIDTYIDYAQKSSLEIKSGNDILDIIVNSKINETKDKGINFMYEIEYIGNIPIQDIDICALMANLLDNAVEACEKVMVGKSWISLKVTRKVDMLLIQIKNSVSSEIVNKKNLFKSEKGNSQLHGWGMRSIERVVNKYGGTEEYYLSNNQIELFITLPI